MKSFTRSHQCDAGDVGDLAKNYIKLYGAMKKEKKETGQPVPCNEGIPVFDEVEVVQKTMFNSKSNKIIGLAMSPDDMSTMHDIYETLYPNRNIKKTNYILQCLRRDLVSNFDVLGPYYKAESSLEHRFLIACKIDAKVKFQAHGFCVQILVCDGASLNLKMIKSFLRHTGTFETRQDVNASFMNPLTNSSLIASFAPHINGKT